MFRTLLKYTYAPLFAVGFLSAALILIDAGASKMWLPLLIIAAIAVSFVAEQIAPYEPAWNHDRGDAATNVAHAIVNEASIVLTVLSLPLVATFVPHFNLWPGEWSLWAQLIAALVIADIGITLAHLASHRWEGLWRLHAVHHSALRLYGLNGLMKHPLHQLIELTVGTAPLMLIGMPVDVAWLLAFAVAIQLLLQHSNVDMRISHLCYLWAVAPVHRHHHLASKTKGDVNFGLFLTLWDHLLGTFMIERPMPKDGDVGVAGQPDYPRGYFAHLMEPFRNH